MKSKWLKIVNPVLFVVALVQVVTGVGQKYVGEELYILFYRVHNILAYALVVLIIVHLYLNWGWITMTFFKRKK
jgi:hypothetical protein